MKAVGSKIVSRPNDGKDAVRIHPQGRGRYEMATEQRILNLLSNNESLMIEALNGKATIAKADKVFKSYIDSDFRNWGLDKRGKATEEVKVDVHEIMEDATFARIFSSINTDPDKLVMTQHQIIKFCEKYPDWLRHEGYGTFFLMKEEGEYFVVYVCVCPGGLTVRVLRLGVDSLWLGEYLHRVVSPQLMPLGQ